MIQHVLCKENYLKLITTKTWRNIGHAPQYPISEWARGLPETRCKPCETAEDITRKVKGEVPNLKEG